MSRVRQVRRVRLTAVLQGHENHILDASCSSDGRRIVTASHDQTARVWDAETGAALLVLRGHEHRVAAASFDPRGERVQITTWGGTTRPFACENRRSLASLTPHARSLCRVALHSDRGRTVAGTTD